MIQMPVFIRASRGIAMEITMALAPGRRLYPARSRRTMFEIIPIVMIAATSCTRVSELCDGIVNNCSNLASGVPTNEIDNDGDGYVECTLDGTWLGASSKKGDDCNDTDASLSPETLWYQDSDEDAFGTSLSTSRQCTQPVGYIATPGDCDDADITVYPGASELCDGQYNNCSDAAYDAGAAPANETDNDADGYVECSVDADGWDGSPVSGGEDCNDLNADNQHGGFWTVLLLWITHVLLQQCTHQKVMSRRAMTVMTPMRRSIRRPLSSVTASTITTASAYTADGAPSDETDNDVDGCECAIDDGGWMTRWQSLGGDDADGRYQHILVPRQ